MSASVSNHFDSKAAIVEDEMKEISFRAKVLRTFVVALAWLCMVRKHLAGLIANLRVIHRYTGRYSMRYIYFFSAANDNNDTKREYTFVKSVVPFQFSSGKADSNVKKSRHCNRFPF